MAMVMFSVVCVDQDICDMVVVIRETRLAVASALPMLVVMIGDDGAGKLLLELGGFRILVA